MKKFIKECFTDTLGRPEPKLILGIPVVIFSIVYLVWKHDLNGSIYIGSLGTTLVGGTAIADSFNDSRRLPPNV